MKKLLLIGCFLTVYILTYGQKDIKEGDKIVFVYFENRPNNLIVIPNIGKLHTFKIYRKQKNEKDFLLVATKTKPPLPMRYNVTPYSVTWEDKEIHSREIDYKVVAFNKKEEQLCEMNIVWEDKK